MAIHQLAGTPAPRDVLVNIPRLVSAFFALRPDPENPDQRVAFGTSGHRGSALAGSFNEWHILAIAHAICEHRAAEGITGPLFLGMDTHALSEAAFVTCLEVLAAHAVPVRMQPGGGYTPTPVVSHAILSWNRGRRDGLADGVIISPSHNPPSDGGIKYNPPSGGPADTAITKRVQDRANEILRDGLAGVRRVLYEKALRASSTVDHDFVAPYVRDLATVLDLEPVRVARLKIGVDPMGGAGIGFLGPIAEAYGLSLDIVNPVVDPTFAFMTLDWDGKIRMDCSSPYAMASLISARDRFQVSTGNDADADRHGIVTPDGGLMNPNHFLAVAIEYLYGHRPGWAGDCGIGKTLVSSSMIDRVAADLGRRLDEVPVGFKWFVPGLLDGSIGFAGEESAGASFLRRDGSVWTTDKDGLLLCLLAAEIIAVTGQSPSERYNALTERHGAPAYARVDAPATPAQKAVLKGLSPEQVTATHLAGEPITAKLTAAPGNGAAIGCLKVTTESAWFAARPSGTEDVYKIYAESFRGPEHLTEVQSAAREVVSAALGS